MATPHPFATRLLCLLLAMTGRAAAVELTYDRDVRPILKAHCFQCHGELGVQKGGLDLRLQRSIVAGGESGPAVRPGQPGDSLLLARVVAGEMPPGKKRLAASDIGRLREWIRQGAAPGRLEPEIVGESDFSPSERAFWLFQPLGDQRPPISVETDSPVDRFIAERLRTEDLTFSPPASRSVLVRRLYYDLLGLPPSPAEVAAFLADTAPAAYERLVDRLLASPRYGERWGRHWLDVAGYADSEGYVDSDPVRPWAFRYRDYVIGAFNAGTPYDQFVVEQLAGDELVAPPYHDLSESDIRRLTAIGFLRMAPDGTGAAGAEPNVARNQTIADTLNIVSTSLLGLTVGCARCHNHRYDPISQKDYYRLRAIFAPALDWRAWKAPDQRRLSLYTAADRDLAARIETKAKAADQHRSEIISAHLVRTLHEELIKSPDNLKTVLKTAYQTASAQRTPEQVALLKKYPNVRNINSGSLYLYSEQRARRADEIAAFADAKERAFIEAVRSAALAALPTTEQNLLEAALQTPTAERSDDQKKQLAQQPAVAVDATTLATHDPQGAALVAEYRQASERCRNTDAKKELADLADAVKQIRATIPEEPFLRTLTEPPDHTPQTFLFRRGDHNAPAEEVLGPAELSIVSAHLPVSIPANDPALPTTGRRLAYARHLTSGRHPLLARVIVNRIWYHHFGRAFVNSLGDFGELGERPTHPQLLDWLSRDLVDSGWQIKRLHRLILSSGTYRQQSTRNERLDTIDPDNRLYARQSMRRVDTEVFRDAVLAVSGQYVNQMAGPPIPVMEDAVGQIVLGQEDLDGERKPRAAGGLGGQSHRRSLYVQVRRSRPLAVLETFDLATVAPNCVKRPASNVAPQALLLINSRFMVDYAEAFAARLQRERGGDLRGQLQHAWQLAYARPVDDQTLDRFVGFIAAQTKRFATSGAKQNGDPQQRALAVACQAILAANQFLYLD
ncbi:MAG: hypothetical protein CMJ59_24445 [Planctomycetaceae bacterium]|nr:hypothetical protein [Planctomycetaceae bacterium]